MSNLILLIFEFFKTGLFAVGGGLTTIPFLTEMSEKYGWFTIEKLSSMIAISESTPGPIGINMATYVGNTVAGVFGGLVVTLSLVAPSIIVICIIANYFQKFKDAKIVKMIFAGLKPAVVAFIASAVLGLFVSTLLNVDAGMENLLEFFDWKCITLLVVLLVAYEKKPKVHPIFFIVAAAVVGIIFKF